MLERHTITVGMMVTLALVVRWYTQDENKVSGYWEDDRRVDDAIYDDDVVGIDAE